MGEFIKHNGDMVKLGVCDELYYTTPGIVISLNNGRAGIECYVITHKE